MDEFDSGDQRVYYHPANVEELKQLILMAKKEGKKIRVRGPAHRLNNYEKSY